MKCFAIVSLGLIGLVFANPAFPLVPLTYATLTSPGAHVITDAEALDNPGIVLARARHATTLHVDHESVHLADNEPARLAARRVQTLRRRSSLLADDGAPILTSPAPLGTDGRVVDTAEVAAAKAAHAAAHVNERLNLANEAARSGDGEPASSKVTDSAIGTPGKAVSPEFDGALNAPEITTARIEQADERVNPANGAARFGDVLKRIDDPVVPLVLRDGVVAALLPVDDDGAPLEVAARDKQSLANDVKTIDALAIAGPILAYGRLVY